MKRLLFYACNLFSRSEGWSRCVITWTTWMLLPEMRGFQVSWNFRVTCAPWTSFALMLAMQQYGVSYLQIPPLLVTQGHSCVLWYGVCDGKKLFVQLSTQKLWSSIQPEKKTLCCVDNVQYIVDSLLDFMCSIILSLKGISNICHLGAVLLIGGWFFSHL